MPLPSSATRRLFDFLTRFHAAGAARRDEPVEYVFRALLTKDDLDSREAFRLYCDLIDLTDRSLAEIRAIFPAGDDPDHREELGALEQPVASLRDTLMSNSPKSHTKVLLQHQPDRLQALAATTSRLVGQQDPSAEQLAKASDALRQALAAFLASDVPQELKESFRAGVERLLRMIDQFSIFGAEGIIRGVGELTGQMSVHPAAREGEAGERVREALTTVANALTIVTGSVHLGLLARPFTQALLGSP